MRSSSSDACHRWQEEHTLKKMRQLTLGLCALGVCLLSGVVTDAHAQNNESFQKIYGLLNRWRAEEANKLAEPFYKSRPNAKSLQYVMARIRYYQGRYKEAAKLYQKALSEKARKKDSIYHSLMATLRLTRGYKQIKSPHFVISYPPGPNEILIPYAIQALERAYKRLGKVFGYYPPDRVHVQILRNALELAEMSPLTKADIVRTGTIALCKYNRVMLTSPLALLRGYRWLDTAVHEYSHLLINRIASGVPIWLHEGLARYSEILWRSDTPQPLSPYSETLLARAIKKEKLVPFKKMHPSMAKLPSQKEAALAYAQVYNLIRYFVKRKGQQSIPKVLQLIQKGTAVPKSFASLVKQPFPHFLDAWKNDLRNSNLREFPDIEPEKKILKGHRPKKTKKQKERERNFWYKPTDKKALGRRYLRLGEMLRRQGRVRAALFEYLKAEKHWKNRDPSLQTKIAKGYIRIRQAAKAIPHLKESLKLYPNHVTTFVQLGRAFFASGQFKQAQEAFEQVNQINPFHPASHQYLFSIYRKLGDNKASERERRIYKKLQRR